MPSYVVPYDTCLQISLSLLLLPLIIAVVEGLAREVTSEFLFLLLTTFKTIHFILLPLLVLVGIDLIPDWHAVVVGLVDFA